ncbi:EamA family transporter [Subtercola endophyticus]|uniref:EamA family transporter n=1 Tax=Subtercola endophyticus TaxID=2895559 RepID=UPI001E5626C1|nr:EamA family transporter [Subtercola endophyticus]UFS58972.1 EamA family transporter [Subtercola endophyticus]
MVAVVLGIVGAFVYGGSDFLGGLAAKRVSPVLVTALSAATGLLILLAVYPVLGGSWSWPAVLWGAASGVSGAVALSLLYACLAIGPMSILSPLTAIMTAIVPLAFGLLTGSRFGVLGYVGLAVALVAVVLVGFVPEKSAVRPSAKALLMATASGALLGLFLVFIDQTPKDSGIVPLLFNRGVNAALLFSAVGVLALRGRLAARGRRASRGRPAVPDARPGPARITRAALLLAIGCGVFDATANVLLLTGIHLGDLAVMSVLTAMYPAGTIVLAAIVLRERIAAVQAVGLVLALVAAGMLALG